ncbi:unnamed protein product [Rhizoctonia solani]|uniref:CHAT domain-containing protein n=1 Tax=Rhizoctonia solani TaxID=456999 RepID=A0A8H3E1F3_9AGAM|nr:unnamed protein product [Rhizoctonia solani]
MEEAFLKAMLSQFSRDIHTTIELQTQLVSLMPDHRSDKPSQLNNLAISYQNRFNSFGELTDIEMSLDCLNKAISLLPVGHIGKPVSLSNLGSAYRNRYETLGNLEDLQKAATYQEQALSLAPDTYEDKPSWYNNIGNTYQRRFERMNDPDDLEKAITYKIQALDLTPDGHSMKPTFLSNLGSAFRSRFVRRGELADIEKSIDYQSQAVNLTSDNDEDKPLWLNNLSISYQGRFERLVQVQDIEKAIVCQVKALSLTPNGHADRPGRMSNLGICHQHRYNILGDTEDLTRAIDYHTQALSLCPDYDLKKSSIYLNLGNSLYQRFLRFGKVADIDNAIERLSTAISLLPVGHADRPLWLNNLGGFYTSRFSVLREDKDIQMATDSIVKSLSLVPDDHPQKPAILAHLATSYQLRSGPLMDLAISCLSRAISLTPDGHQTKSSYLQNLGRSHHLQYIRLKDIEDLDNAIRYQTSAIALAPDTLPFKANWFNELGESYQCRFDSGKNIEDLDKAITHYSTALSNVQSDYAYSSLFYYHLACAYETRFTACNTQGDLSAAILAYRQATHPNTSILTTHTAFIAARKWTKLASLHHASSVHEAYRRAMELMPQILWLGSTIEQRYSQLREMGDFALEAASHAISIQSYDLALEWLEQGRSIVWNQILDLRTPFDDLAAVDPGLANELQSVGQNLDRAGSRQANLMSSIGEMLDLKREAQRHRELASEWESLLDKIRKIPGFEGFLRPKRIKDLLKASKNGPVIVVNVSELQGDALIIAPNNSQVAHVPLPGMSRSKAILLRSQFRPLLRDQRLISRQTRGVKVLGYNPRMMFEKVLATLWTEVVEPVLHFLGIKNPSTEDLPRVTWCTTGELAGLPLHAAGLYDGSQPNAFDLIISAYTPTISALLASFSNSSIEFSGILAVGQANTPGFTRIGNTIEELASIKERCQAMSSAYTQLQDDKATVEAVLAEMERASWVHFACHASQKGDDPTNSAFHLYDGSLSLHQINQKPLKNKGLAFLSACQTATGTEDLPDEAVHLAAGLLIAGYPSVIGTLWSVYDEDAPEVSKELYTYLINQKGSDHTKAAKALHGAVQKLRKRVGNKLFERWVPFIHLGV